MQFATLDLKGLAYITVLCTLWQALVYSERYAGYSLSDPEINILFSDYFFFSDLRRFTLIVLKFSRCIWVS